MASIAAIRIFIRFGAKNSTRTFLPLNAIDIISQEMSRTRNQTIKKIPARFKNILTADIKLSTINLALTTGAVNEEQPCLLAMILNS